jgi:hypothetical protein
MVGVAYRREDMRHETCDINIYTRINRYWWRACFLHFPSVRRRKNPVSFEVDFSAFRQHKFHRDNEMAKIISTFINGNISMDHESFSIIQSTQAITIEMSDYFPCLLALTNTLNDGSPRRLLDQLPWILTTNITPPGIFQPPQ